MLKLKHPDKKLFILSAQLIRNAAGNSEFSVVQGYRISSNKEDAIGFFVIELQTVKQGFVMANINCLEVPWDSLVEEAGKIQLN